MKIRQNVTELLRCYKEAHDLTLTEMAELLGIGRSSLQEYLTGQTSPRADTLEQIMQKLGLPLWTTTDDWSSSQWDVVRVMYGGLSLVSRLSEAKQKRCFELIIELISLWNENEDA